MAIAYAEANRESAPTRFMCLIGAPSTDAQPYMPIAMDHALLGRAWATISVVPEESKMSPNSKTKSKSAAESALRHRHEAEAGVAAALVSGAAVGAMAGPPGAAAGAVIGGIVGALASGAYEKEAAAAARYDRELDAVDEDESEALE